MTREQKINAWYNKKQEEERIKWKKEHCTSKAEYSSYLLNPKWLNRRNYIFGLRGEVCGNCGTTTLLQVHHIRYTGKYPWEAPDNDLICLCKECHTKAHNEDIDCDNIILEFNNLEDDKDRVLCFKNNNFLYELSTTEAVNSFGNGVIKCCDGINKTCKGYTFKYVKIGKIKTEDKQIVEKLKSIKERITDIVGINIDQLYELYNKGLILDFDFKFLNSVFRGKNLTHKQIKVLEQISERTKQYTSYEIE